MISSCGTVGLLRVAGTHGKPPPPVWRPILKLVVTSRALVIGGVPGNFDVCASGESLFFVIEADEYDCAFFDKRPSLYTTARTLILNNIEFDHADIFDDLKAIQKQFHHLVRIVPGSGPYHPAGERYQS